MTLIMRVVSTVVQKHVRAQIDCETIIMMLYVVRGGAAQMRGDND